MKMYNFILTHPRKVISVILIITFMFAWQAKDIRLSNSISELLPAGHPAMTQDLEVKFEFNSREMILIGIINENGIFNPLTLQKIKELSDLSKNITVVSDQDIEEFIKWQSLFEHDIQERIEQILENSLSRKDIANINLLINDLKKEKSPNARFISFLEKIKLKLNPISDIISLTEAEDLQSFDGTLEIYSPMKDIPQTETALDSLKNRIFSNEMYITGMVSEDAKGTLILAELSFYYDDHLEIAHSVFEKLEKITAPFNGPEDVYLAGVPMVNVYTSNYMSGDLERLMPIVILVLSLIIYLSFRFVKGVFIPLCIVAVALIWTLGLMAILNRPITLITSAIPIMLIAVAIADGIHLISEYQFQLTKYNEKRKAIFESMRHLTGPVVITSLTDIAGFSSLAISDLRSIQDFGLFTAFGVFSALIFSLVFIPAFLILMGTPSKKSIQNSGRGSLFSRLLLKSGRFFVLERKTLYGFSLAFIFAGIAFLMQIEVGSTMVGYFKEDSKIFQASEKINEKFGGTEVLNIIIDTQKESGLKEPALLKNIKGLQDTLEQNEMVGYTTSLADYIKRINLIMNENESSFNRIPDEIEKIKVTDWEIENGKEVEVTKIEDGNGRNLVAQYLLLYEMSGTENLYKLSDNNFSKANVIAQIRTDDTPELKNVRDVADEYVKKNFPDSTKVYYAGCSNLCVVADELIIPSQLKSLGFAFLVVFVLLWIIFRSFKYSLMGIMPLALTVLMVFALMGMFRVNLDAVTALIASIVLGVGIDYSVHFISRYKSFIKNGMPHEKALEEVLVTSGRPILFNAFAVGFGFLVLVFSSFWAVIHIGWLVAANMFLGAIITLALLPALLTSFLSKK